MDFLRLRDKKVLVLGVANRKSVAYFAAKTLEEAGANVIHSVQSEGHRDVVKKLFPEASCYLCDVEDESDIKRLAEDIKAEHKELDGMVHSLAFANYSEGLKPFHETKRADFLQALNISCFSLTALANALKDVFTEDASVVTIGISTTRMASENYGYMAPIKAALDSSVAFLAKSFSAFSNVRFNSVNPGLLKTSASAGIPGYLDCYLYAEAATLRKKNVSTAEVGDVITFLLSSRSSAINAQHIVIDAGMSINYFDKDIVKKATRIE